MTLADPTATDRQPDKFTVCPRCKRPVYVSNAGRHPVKCNGTPTPVELAAEFLGDEFITINDLVSRYAGGIAPDKLSRKHLAGRARPKARRLTLAEVGPTCRRCLIRLDHAEVPTGTKGFCGWCRK